MTDDVFKKILLLYAASYCEDRMSATLTDLYESSCAGKGALTNFVKNQALRGQYFKLFDWETQKATKFFKLFGQDFHEHMSSKIKNEPIWDNSIRAFLELGHLRNTAIHENLAMYNLDKTIEEVLKLYKDAAFFIEGFPAEIQNHIEQIDQNIA